MGPLRLLHSFHKQKRRQSAPLLQRSSAMSVCVGPRLLLIAVARVVAVASHHLIARGAEGVALVPVRPLVAVDQDAADAVQRLQVLDHAVQLPAVGVLVARLVVAVGVVVPCRGLAGLAAALDQVLAAFGVQRRHAGLGEVEVVGAEVEAAFRRALLLQRAALRLEEHTSELQSLMRISYAVFCLKKKKK